MRRRQYITAISAGSVLSISGCSEISSLTDSEPENEIKTIEPEDSYFTKIALYENGDAEITLTEDHGEWARIAITHANNELTYDSSGQDEDAYAVWDAPQFEGPVTVDMKSAIQDNGPYPSPTFKLKLRPPEGENIIDIGGGPSIATEFEVPKSYMPE
ncbi:hypothetical protein [Haloarcula laminariae]|uniref:hypothetical protein n=1 Tax=Haloarcula laminariae TaxID=2961577 RepID=UPI0021C74B8B|nr:hypothetical protein [Halomicroarcula laminariae]